MTMPADFAFPAVDESSPRYDGWRVTAVCFVVAMFCWGFGLYSHGIYLAELQRLFGWSASLISGATTAYYLLTASLVVFISDAIVRLGPRRVFLLGTCCLGSAVALLAFIVAPWQLYLVYLIMAMGSAAMHVGAITNVLGLWFDRQRGLAISLALNGASSGGIFVAPTLIVAIAETGFAAAMVGAATVMAAILIPAITIGIDRPPVRTEATGVFASARRIEIGSGFCLRTTSLDASGGVAEPRVLECGGTVRPSADGPGRFPRAPDRLPRTGDWANPAGLTVAVLTVMAIVGRLALGVSVLRLDLRRVTALSLVSQAAALFAMTQTTNAAALFLACAIFGLSAGNLVSLPALIIQREFEATSFGMLVGLSTAIGQFTYALGPGLLGIVRDATGGYTAALTLCMMLELAAAGTIQMSRLSGSRST